MLGRWPQPYRVEKLHSKQLFHLKMTFSTIFNNLAWNSENANLALEETNYLAGLCKTSQLITIKTPETYRQGRHGAGQATAATQHLRAASKPTRHICSFSFPTAPKPGVVSANLRQLVFMTPPRGLLLTWEFTTATLKTPLCLQLVKQNWYYGPDPKPRWQLAAIHQKAPARWRDENQRDSVLH